MTKTKSTRYKGSCEDDSKYTKANTAMLTYLVILSVVVIGVVIAIGSVFYAQIAGLIGSIPDFSDFMP